jgi:ABC-type multidrug transport system fused ATPase/permease subunit
VLGFRYQDGNRFVLQDISFTLERGKRIAIVGPSGAAKSTLAGLVFRCWNATEGETAIGGCDVRGYAQDHAGPLHTGHHPQAVRMESMDEILVLERGRIVERGTHAELEAGHGTYRGMLDVQREILAAG